ncbi:HGL188Cp [Eremothecium sinecaudum]|uniref:Peptide hydrolase n=1 Tax=Eremothecium sinecaudum TaxID=45286 RepID=A0A0X8HVC6_9SACH|nr:HGL188Cp [Eremothecium sinecaudum]AMD22152.1 HGL188Cp [Eremothecium sinecaudum]
MQLKDCDSRQFFIYLSYLLIGFGIIYIFCSSVSWQSNTKAELRRTKMVRALKDFIATPFLLILAQFSHAHLLGKSYYDSTLEDSMSLIFDSPRNLILPFNKTRIPGSKNSKSVQRFITSNFEHFNQDWKIERDTFVENGHEFTNLVFTLGSGDYLMLSAHYDTKILEEGEFIGAIDSAAPCAMLLYVAGFLDRILTDNEAYSLKPTLLPRFTGVKIVFFDGEEAIKEWTATDSLYGSRHLASKWQADNTLQSIKLMVLLDLLGSADQNRVPNFFEKTRNYYNMIWAIEERFKTEYGYGSTYFDPYEQFYGQVNDDHEPFLYKGVPVLHLIARPFPRFWHTLDDTFENLDQEEVNKWTILICEFVLQYFS